MRAADLATMAVMALMAAGVFAGFYYWQADKARAEEERYEAALDAMIDRKIGAVGLSGLAPTLAAHGEARLEALRALYDDRAHSDRLNLGFGELQREWPSSYEYFAEQAGREVEDGRLQAEVDDRFGPGAHALMRERYAAFLADLPRRTIEEQERPRREMQEWMRALEAYERRHGRYPNGAFRVENGRVVED